MPAVLPARRLRCERCGVDFACGAASSDTGPGCWCQDLPPLKERLPEGDCLCPDCLRGAAKQQQPEPDGPSQRSGT
ncbi:cysteine-rich CWC family protein [Aquabacter cavernae]|uniref:cysteine-rich CWC family protein n=1 Tax=Aquabacter cavernae TaxID=2496029 RepID=UPI0013DED146|nr:cysteine-rich CWC family protein [Aquabacter cavernae]